MMLGVFLLSSCAKDTTVPSSATLAEEQMSPADLAKTQEIKDFIASVNGEKIETRAGDGDGSPTEYTPVQFVKQTEDAINYTYSMPFEKFWDIETKKDSTIIPITDCKITAAQLAAKYALILAKVQCKFFCSNLANKKLKFVKVTILTSDCNTLKVEITTSVGTTVVTTSLSEAAPSPGDLALPNFKRKFTSDLWAEQGTCINQTLPIKSSTETGKKATYSMIGGADPAHTLINAQTIYLNAHQNPLTSWWYGSCYDDFMGSPGGCGGTTNCLTYFNPILIGGVQEAVNYNSLNTTGIAHWCLTTAELNSKLASTETHCLSLANQANKKVVNLSMDWTFSLCGDLDHLWIGELTMGTKIPRTTPPILLPTLVCNCQ